MTKDFRASQIQTTQIISSGSSGTGAKIVFYDVTAQDTGQPNQGKIDPNLFSTSSIGNDTFLYISGGIGDRNSNNQSITVFGGDLMVSGNFLVAGDSDTGPEPFRLAIVDYANTTNTSSNPQSVGQIIFNGAEFSGSVTLRAILNSASPGGTAVVKLLELTSASYVEIGGPGIDELSVTGADPTIVESVDLYTAANFITNDIGKYELSIHTETSGVSAFVGGAEIKTLGSYVGGTVIIKDSTWIASSSNLKTTSSVAIDGENKFANEIGQDVYFFVSGTFGSGSAGDKVAVFGGDVRISGTLAVGTGTTFIKGDSINVGGSFQYRTTIITGSTTLTNTDACVGITNNTSDTIDVYLPPGPVDGQSIYIKDIFGNGNEKAAILRGNGNNIDGAGTKPLNTAYYGLQVIYFTSQGWSIFNSHNL